MANISVSSADAVIAYGGTWDDRAPNARYAGAPWSSATVVFNGTTFRAYGLFNSTNVRPLYIVMTIHQHMFKAIYACTVDGEQRDSTTAPFQLSSDVNQPFLEISNLNDNTHTVTLNITGGALGLSRMEWYDAQARSVPATSKHEFFTDRLNLNTTSTASASIVFSFQGTGIAVTGIVGPSAGTFNAILDGTPFARNAWAQYLNHSAIL
ncbi:hypothetical protein FRC09_008080, partial [Ceratobasidium sp. 395]